jgi:hypothetical protein
MLGLTVDDLKAELEKKGAPGAPASSGPSTKPMPQPPGAAATPTPKATPDDSARTILGLQSPIEGARSSSPAPAPVPAPDGKPPAAGDARTMLGVQVDISQLEAAARERTAQMSGGATPPSSGPQAASGEAGRPRAMVSGLSQPRRSDLPPAPAARDSLSSASVGSSSSTPSMTTSASWVVRRRGAPMGLVVALMIVGALALGAAIWLGLKVVGGERTGSRLAVTVARSPAEDQALLELTLTPFTPGTEVELLGQKKAVDAGRVRFELAMQSLAVGPNDIPVTIHDPGGNEVEQVRVVLRYRVRPDLSGLAGATASYALVFEVVPGARVEVDGRPLAPDAQGKLVYVVPLAQALANGPSHTVEFRVVPTEGAPEVGRVTTTLPVSTLTVDRPADGAVVEADSIECAGATDAGATLTINGQVVTLTGDRFLHRVALPEHKDYTLEIVAVAPGKAPTTLRRAVRRVESLQAEIAAFAATVDRALTYARVSTNPSIYRGQHARFLGKVFNARTEAGETTLQILLHTRDCPEGMRCSLWVSYRGETDARIGDWVDVLGTLDGEQSYQTTRGERLTVPKIDARFVVKRAPPG